jgi:hypothetical protein
MKAEPRPPRVTGSLPPHRDTPTRRHTPGRWALLAAVVALAGVLAVGALTNIRRGAVALVQPATHMAPPAPVDPKHQARERAGPHLDRADADCRRALDEQLRDLDDFFAAAHRRTPRFVEQVLGWGSTWQLIQDRLPGAQGNQHPMFVRHAFHETLFSPEQLEGRARQAVEGYLEAVRDIEGVLLVQLRQGLAELPTTLPLAQLDQEAVLALYERAVATAAERAGVGLTQDAARDLVSLVVGEALAQAAVRLGVSAGLSGPGAAASAATLGAGLGLVVGLQVDQILRWAWDAGRDLIRSLEGRLDDLRRVVMEGTAEAPGLRRRLEHLDRERAAARRQAALDLIGHPEIDP